MSEVRVLPAFRSLIKRARKFATSRDKANKPPEYYRGVYDSNLDFLKEPAKGQHWQSLIMSYEAAIGLLHQLAELLAEHREALADIAHTLHYKGDAGTLVSAFRSVWEGNKHYYQHLDPTRDMLAEALLDAIYRLREGKLDT